AIYQIDETSSRLVTSEQAPPGGMYGARVAAGDGFAVAAIVQGEGLEGTAAVFEESGEDWREAALLRGDDVGLDAVVGAKMACRDGKASLFDCKKVELVSFLPVRAIGGGRGTRLNDLWGWTDSVTGKEYALVGRTDGTAFVDMSDPVNPVYLGSLPLTKGARPTIWRDIKVYKDHAFIVADGTPDHGMQVFDLAELRDVENAPVIFKETAVYDGLENAHNVAINEETGYAYTVGGDKCAGGLHMVDIRDPRNPTFAGCFAHENTSYGGRGSTHDTQCVVYRGPDAEHQGKEICFSSNGTALSIADVTDKANPKPISIGSFPDYAFVHQGWLTEDQRYFYMNDELDEFVGNAPETRTLVWDLIDLEDPQLVLEYMFGVTAADHNLYIRGNYMYQSNYLSGLRIHDISDPENPREVAYFDTAPSGENTTRLDGSWSNYPYFESGVIPVSSKEEGLFLVRMADEPGL
ncbi:MAG: choice-of-anchor B family protein, partial [Rhodothermales bacterium]